MTDLSEEDVENDCEDGDVTEDGDVDDGSSSAYTILEDDGEGGIDWIDPK